MKTTLLLLIVLLTTFSCTREKVTPIDQQCNATISFSNDVMPILEANCISCHNLEILQVVMTSVPTVSLRQMPTPLLAP